jgi:hypothetical protein
VGNGNVHAAGDQGMTNGHGVEPGGLSTMRSLSVSVMLTPSNHDGRWGMDGEVSPASFASTSTVEEKDGKVSSEETDKGRLQGKGKDKGKGREGMTKVPDEAPVLPALTLVSAQSHAPHWWFDRQALSLGGVCDYEEGEEEDEEPLPPLPQYYSNHPPHLHSSEFSPSSPSSSSTQPHLSSSSSRTYALASSPSPMLGDSLFPSSTRTSSHTILSTTPTSLPPPPQASSRGPSSQRTPPSLTSTSLSISIPVAGGSSFRMPEEHELGEISPRRGKGI